MVGKKNTRQSVCVYMYLLLLLFVYFGWYFIAAYNYTEVFK